MFSKITSLLKIFKSKNVRTHDIIFSIHTDLTVIILIISCLILSAKQYFGHGIYCNADGSKNKDLIENQCWALGTFLMDIPGKVYRVGDPEKGLGPTNNGERIYFRYYQWVTLILFLQAIVFRIPLILWNVWEGGKLEELTNDIGDPITEDEQFVKKTRYLLLYFSSESDLQSHYWYACRYIFCELLNFIICILNIMAMQVIFHNFWVNYAHALLAIPKGDWYLWNDLTSEVFPKYTKCEYFLYGASGSFQSRDTLCFLNLNVVNEKIFALLWVWFLVLTFISCMRIVYRTITMCCKTLQLYLLRVHVPELRVSQLQTAFPFMRYSDWFMLMRVADTINSLAFRFFMADMYTIRRGRSLEHKNGKAVLV